MEESRRLPSRRNEDEANHCCRREQGYHFLKGLVFILCFAPVLSDGSLLRVRKTHEINDSSIQVLRDTNAIDSTIFSESRANDFQMRLPQKEIKRKTQHCDEGCQSEESNDWVQNIPMPLTYIIICVLVLFSAFFSGLTLALMGLDTTGLEIVMSGDDPAASRAAAKIYPVRKNGNLLLCTLLVGNVAVNTLLGILMADITGGAVGFVSSTVLIVIFGEIIPQAVFSRYALKVGEKVVPIVKVVTCLLYIISKPLAFCLDTLLGRELGTTYSKAELKKLLEIHVQEGRFNKETGDVMTGALKYQDVTVKEVMTSLENTFVINVDEKLNFDTITNIFKTGFSRIPVWEASVSNIIGLIFVKDLIFVDPDDEIPIKDFVKVFGRGAHVVWPDDSLGEVLRILKKGSSHMALVRDVNNDDETQDPYYELKGIITLEDIIEVILGEEIVDETDAWVDGNHLKRVDRSAHFDWARLGLLDAKIVRQSLSEDEVRAVAAHLRVNYSSAVSSLTDRQLNWMIASTDIAELPEAQKEIGELLPSNLLYKKNNPCSVTTLILSGKVSILAGKDNFRADISSWSILAAGAFTQESYIPDFSAYVSGGPCRCLQISRECFLKALELADENDLDQSSVSFDNDMSKDNTQHTKPFRILKDDPAHSNTTTNHSIELSQGENLMRGKDRGKLMESFLKTKSIMDSSKQ